ncbi:MAG: DUF1800 domain-containing protein [Blastocatellia bacterium]
MPQLSHRHLRLLVVCLCAGVCNSSLTPAYAASAYAISPVRPSLPAVPAVAEADAVRLLEQATFGPTDASVARVQSLGIEGWLQEQFFASPSSYPNLTPFPGNSAVGCPAGSAPNCFRDNYTMHPLQVRFFQNALTGADQLRQRVAFALSQIFVVSGAQIQQPSSMAPFQNILLNNALGNFRQLLYEVTLSPAMGDYLDMVNNDKPNPATGVEPNENYAREILQLFTIGTIVLNQDGTPQLDAFGQPIPSYDQDIIEAFAHAFTGWTYAPLAGATPRPHNPANYQQPMILYRDSRNLDVNHDKSAKKVLSYPKVALPTLPADQTGDVDLNRALDNIFYHPNVGPFIGKQLIQHLVTSNPSSGYVSRVAAVFNNNGVNVRGDLRAVVKAILLDPEARDSAKGEGNYGHLREPVLFVTNLLRAFTPTSDYVLANQAAAMGQNLFNAPSVFNYFPPDYVVPGTPILGPEMALQSSAAALSRANFVNTIVFGRIGTAPEGTQIDLTGLQALAGNPAALVDKLNRLLLHGTMSAAMQTELLKAINSVASNNPKLRAQTALYLVAASSQYQVER